MGMIMVFTKMISLTALPFYLIAAVIFIGYTPISIRYRAHKQVKGRDVYCFDENDGITVLQGEQSTHYGWEKFKKVVVTPKTIGIYYEEDRVLIIPKEDFSNRFVPIMNMVMTHVGLELKE